MASKEVLPAHPYSTVYGFRHTDGRVVRFGPGDHLRVWRNIPGPAHELLSAFNDRCLHSPGPGDMFREDTLAVALQGVRVLEVINRAKTLAEAQRRIERGLRIVGLPWNAVSANCQDTLTWIVTGTASSYQREALVGAVVAIGLCGLLVAASSSQR